MKLEEFKKRYKRQLEASEPARGSDKPSGTPATLIVSAGMAGTRYNVDEKIVNTLLV